MDIEKTYIKSPVGTIEVSGSQAGVRSILFVDNDIVTVPIPFCLKDCVSQLIEYFAGKRRQFQLILDPKGTDFQLSVWEQLQLIPFGETISYLDLARMTGNLNNTRAVGNANGRNKLNIVIPCHRVIGSNGKLTGYGGGIWRKEFLLKFEMGDSLPGLFSELQK